MFGYPHASMFTFLVVQMLTCLDAYMLTCLDVHMLGRSHAYNFECSHTSMQTWLDMHMLIHYFDLHMIVCLPRDPYFAFWFILSTSKDKVKAWSEGQKYKYIYIYIYHYETPKNIWLCNPGSCFNSNKLISTVWNFVWEFSSIRTLTFSLIGMSWFFSIGTSAFTGMGILILVVGNVAPIVFVSKSFEYFLLKKNKQCS